jgi:peptide/nickel transport system ATP-binding protein
LTLLEVRDLHVHLMLSDGRRMHVVRGISFALDAGERLGLVGESGCGKTTAVLALMGLLPATAMVSGTVTLDGTDILSGGENGIRRHRWTDVAMVFQGAMNALNPVQRVGAQIAEPMVLHRRMKPRAALQRAVELLERAGLPSASAESYPHQLSGGMRQRAAIAMALACQPKILLADEPTTALDVMVQAQIQELLESLTSEFGLALLLVTHDLAAMSQLCPRTAVMYAGEIVEEAPTPVLFDEPLHPYTRLLVKSIPEIGVRNALAHIPGAPPRLDVPIGGCPFRPRCPDAVQQCESTPPRPRQVGPDRAVACHLASVASQLPT